mgnify:CR=1 FL=1
MLFWTILLGVSIVGVFSLLLFRSLKPEVDSEEGGLLRDHLHKGLGNVRNLVLKVAKVSGVGAGRGLSIAYSKGLSVMKKTKFPALIKGRGVLKEKDVTSNFLRDVKEHKDKVREELTNKAVEEKVE